MGVTMKRKVLFTVAAIPVLVLLGTILYLGISNQKSERIQKNHGDYVILLHGMGRMKASMRKVETYLHDNGYETINVNYPTTKEPIEELSDNLQRCVETYCIDTTKRVHIVTHSLGGIVARYYLTGNSLPEGSRVVMMAPPNRGSEISDKLLNFPPYEWLNGPAGMQLTTDSSSIPNSLADNPSVEIGILTGTKSNDPWFNHLFSGEHDGKVTVESAKLDHMKDFKLHPVTHTFIMKSDAVVEDIYHFIKHGRFTAASSEQVKS
jgi:triacylglycerol lipase